jgi:predicted nucleotidyltransferase
MDPLIEKNRAAIIRIAGSHGAGNVRLFGSMARGEARTDSDVDLLIDIVGPTTPWFPGGLVNDLEQLLGRHIDVATVKQLDELIRDDVLKEAVSL